MPDQFNARQVIAHRGWWLEPREQNTIPALRKALEAGYGIEVDLRSFRGDLVLSHDPVRGGARVPRFCDLLLLLQRHPESLCFLNVKEDGLLPLLDKLRDDILDTSTVFFDMSIPELVQYAREWPARCLATRVSDIETEPHAAGWCDWFWVDGFDRDLSEEELRKIVKRHPQHLAFVSPSLHGRSPEGVARTVAALRKQESRDILWCADMPAKAPEVREKPRVRAPSAASGPRKQREPDVTR